MTAPRLYRVTLEVGDGPRASAFYARLLGVDGRRASSERTYFDCGGVIVALVDVSPTGRAARPHPEHLYFAVADVDAVHAIAAALGALDPRDVHGAPAGDVTRRPWGERSFYALDPWGNHLCFVDATTLSTGR